MSSLCCQTEQKGTLRCAVQPPLLYKMNYLAGTAINLMSTLVHYTSYCTYSHSLGADEHNKELLALTDILQEDVTDRLKQIGLGT